MRETVENIIRSSIWSTPSVSQQPVVLLVRWQVIEVQTKDQVVQRHFVGYNMMGWEGRVSTAIEHFDPVAKRGITRSGRVYQLEGEPGLDPDALWVWRMWAPAQGFCDEKDVTEEIWNSIVECNPTQDMGPT